MHESKPSKGEALMQSQNYLKSWQTRGIPVVLSLAVIICAQSTFSQALRSKEEIGRIVAIENLAVQNGTVSGEAHNNSANTLRDVQLFIRYTWLWDNEFHPGSEDPGTSSIYTLPEEIPPGGRLPFTFSPSPPLPKVPGGQFVSSVSVAGFTEVIPQTR
jgi:hypothetical protein